MLHLLGQYHLTVKKMHDFDVFNECVTDQQTDRQTDKQTHIAYYKDAWTHLKTENRS